MKKHKPIKMNPLFNKEKAYIQFMQDPKKMQELKDMVSMASRASEKLVKPTTLDNWLVYVLSILPKFENDVEFTEKLGVLVNEYSNELERSNPTEPC